jgi:hypothetical protein
VEKILAAFSATRLNTIRGSRSVAPQQLSPYISFGCLVRQGVTNPDNAPSKLNEPFFNVIAPGHSAAAISSSQIQQFTNQWSFLFNPYFDLAQYKF